MDEKTGLISFVKKLPDALKGWLVLISSLAGIILAIRVDKQLYGVLITSSILLFFIVVSILVVFVRLPGKFSNKHGPYRYENYRSFAFSYIGFVLGFILAFTLFEPNRIYVSQALNGTPTQSLTVEPSLTITVTSGINSTATPPLPTDTVTTTPSAISVTETPNFVFSENFIDNSNGWILSDITLPLYSSTAKIIGGELIVALKCSSGYALLCENWMKIPVGMRAKDFQLEFNVDITNLTQGRSALLGVRYRYKDDAYYTILFSNSGTYTILLYRNGRNEFVQSEKSSPFINRDEAENHYRIVANSSQFTIYANEKEIDVIEDGNLGLAGDFYIGVNLPDYDNNFEAIFDNIRVLIP